MNATSTKKGATMMERTLLKVNEMKKSTDPQQSRQYDADNSESYKISLIQKNFENAIWKWEYNFYNWYKKCSRCHVLNNNDNYTEI